MVTQLLAFVRPSQISISPTLLDDVLPWCASMFRSQAAKKGIELVIEKRADGIMVMADREMLRQMLMNLILNAIQAFSSVASERSKKIVVTIGLDALEPHVLG